MNNIDKAIQFSLTSTRKEWALMYRAYSSDWWIAYKWERKPKDKEVKEKKMLVERGIELGLIFAQNRLKTLPVMTMFDEE
jgi:hypothetical protein